MFGHYAKYSKYADRKKIEKNLLKETDTWLTAKEAIKHKLADKLLTDKFEFAETIQVEGKSFEGNTAENEIEEIKTEMFRIQDRLDDIMSLIVGDPDAPSDIEIEEVGMTTGSVSDHTTGGEMITFTETPEPEVSREEVRAEVRAQLKQRGADTQAAIRAGIRRALGKVD